MSFPTKAGISWHARAPSLFSTKPPMTPGTSLRLRRSCCMSGKLFGECCHVHLRGGDHNGGKILFQKAKRLLAFAGQVDLAEIVETQAAADQLEKPTYISEARL